MEIRLRINGAEETFRPGSTISGTVELSSDTPVDIGEVELRLTPPPGCTTTHELTGKLSRGMTLQGTKTLPLAANLTRGAGRDAEGTWKLEVIVSAEDWDEYKASTPIRVAPSAGQKTGDAISALLFAIPFLVAGGLGMGFGIGGIPEKIIPEGVLWIAFVGGILLMLAARAILGSKDPLAVTPWLASPLALLLLAATPLGVYVAMVQPDFVPLRLDFAPGEFQSVFMLADQPYARPQLMGLLAATVLATTAGGLFSRKRIPPGIQVDIALTAAATACTLVCIGFIGSRYQQTGELAIPEAEFLIAGVVGAVTLFSAFKRSTWTQAPLVTLLAGTVPLSIGILGLTATSSGSVETATAWGVTAWGGIVMFLGGRNVLASAISGRVRIDVAPNPASIGETVIVTIQASPNPGVRFTGATGVLRCELFSQRSISGEQQSNVYTLHKERNHVEAPASLSAGEAATIELRFTIPLGSRPSDTGTQAVTWMLDVQAHFGGGRPDHAEEFILQVT